VILDVRLPGLDGLSALARLRQLTADAPVIVITAYGNLSTAVRAVEGGAFEYLTKPFDLDQALDAVARALQRRSQPGPPPASTGPEADPGEIVGRSPAMQAVFRRIALVAPRDACVLITGESGTGKELVARAVHRHSPRADRPFLPVHIAALNPGLVESELFGHAKGAFTGAEQARPGLLALAAGGTVLLDELADIPLPVQVKLLRVLEHGEVFPVGASRPQRLDVRVLAATHQDLFRRVGEGAFRHDLFFRLNVFQVHLPPLRERPGDVPLLAEHFLRRLGVTAPVPPRRCGTWRPSRGRATSASCATPWSTRPSSPGVGRCCRSTSRNDFLRRASRPTRCPRPCGAGWPSD
jgi:two-component system nitrogen regulation response regulator GlnG